MAFENDSPLSLDRFLWVQSFAARLAELGAPGGAEHHRELGADWFESNKTRDPLAVAEFVWSRWPTQFKDLGHID